MIFYGLTLSGSQRMRCKNCKHTFTFHNYLNKRNQEKVWFKLWMIEGYSIRQLHDLSKHSHSKLRRIIQFWLNNPPQSRIDFLQLKNMIFDGTFIDGRKSIIAIMNSFNHEICIGKYGIAENSIPQLTSFFLPLLKQGLCPKSVTVDGNIQVIRFFRATWPNILIQRCLVHIQRQGMMWCRRFPKRTDAIYLRRLFQRVAYINNIAERDQFLSEFYDWEKRFGLIINLKPETGKVFSDIKRARSIRITSCQNLYECVW